MADRTRVEILDALRGIAALAVALFHFTQAEASATPWLRAAGRYGYVGVGVFFVISGFVIPFALHRAGYAPGMFGRFLAKRMTRLHPPFLAAAALAVALTLVSSRAPGFAGQAPVFSCAELSANAFYAADFFGFRWVNPVFWTLAVEVQYYVLAAAAFPALAAARQGPRWLAAAALLALPFVGPNWPVSCVHHYLGLFGLGIAAFQFRAGLWGCPAFLALTTAFAVATSLQVEIPEALAGAATGLAIAFAPVPRGAWLRPFVALGSVSYSLYLLHVPVGGRVMNLALRLPQGSAAVSLCSVAAAVGLSCAAAFAFHRLVEMPAQRWASRIKYRPASPDGNPS